MIEAIVARVLRFPALVVALVALVIGGGLAAYSQLNIEAYPNPVPPLVEVIAQPYGYNAEEVERFVTIPLEVSLSGMPGLEHMRSQSLFELSDTKCYFDWSVEYKDARREVLGRLQLAVLASGVTTTISPWNAVGEIFRYTLEGEGYSALELKAAQDFVMERQLKRVPGVIDVTSFGGETKEYHVAVDPFRMRAQGVSLDQISSALQNANQNVGGQRMTLGTESYDVRGVGLIRDVHDVEDVVVTEQRGTPIRVREIGDVSIGPAPRLGQIGQNERSDVLEAIVLMRYGAETAPTMAGVKQRLRYIEENHLLPPGMYVKPYYERSALVNVTTHTVKENLLIGMVLVVLTLLLFLGNGRAALITALNIPLALLIAFSGLVLTGTSANLISLGAIDFGIVIDSSVIMMENLFRHLGPEGTGTTVDRIRLGAREVATPMAFSTAIITLAFLPLFTFTGVPGVIFAPMARTYAFAIGGAIVLAITLIPVLASKLLPAVVEEKESVVMRYLHRIYDPLFDIAIAHPVASIILRILPLVACVVLFPMLGREFMPKLEEGNLWIRATLPMGISREQAAQYADRMRGILRGCPKVGPCDGATRTHREVLAVTSQVGRPDDGTDVTLFSNVELFAPLAELPHGLTKEKLIEQLHDELVAEFPGTAFGFSQMILDNVQEAVSGVKGENSIKVVGPSVEENERVAEQVLHVIEGVRGVTDLAMFRSMGQPSVRITADRRALARYGMNTGDLGSIIQTAIGGQVVTRVFEGEKNFALTVRFAPQYRDSVEAVRALTVITPDGSTIPLATVANIEQVTGPATIYREDAQRYIPVKFSVRGRDLAGTIEEAKRSIAAHVTIPYGMHLEWSGEINELAKAEQRLFVVIPLSLTLIALLVYAAVRNVLDTILVLLDIPVACAGGLLALLITGTNLSVSAAMGFVSIFGLAVQDSLLIVTYFQRLYQQGMSLEAAAKEASEKRFRSVLMTTLVATLGLLPAAVSNGIGAQTQKPLAIVVIGGSLTLAVLVRILQPPTRVLAYRWIERRKQRRAS
ncbi:Cobalt-zinc-cadmium resistance protein CzcA [Labilithrix luteola]|uniref:Cobalt-zinc-cadmium resistance protein CzcA n=1 Tax=Labilithrix luteola TaxID=1391654 RepID=A0A0K1PK48_9BACT|nr:CusA/CzcA family heavy metal efflux RND transporter [Labilithrix luteola]AKU93905.1 Cobalt-zinc-cadmium resistance protein CzcA [Labilithrix luteola]